jgi:hypothetical protein
LTDKNKNLIELLCDPSSISKKNQDHKTIQYFNFFYVCGVSVSRVFLI